MIRTDITDCRFGFLTALTFSRRESDGKGGGKTYWLFRCDCGTEIERWYGSVVNRPSAFTSCGCQQGASVRARNLKHDMSSGKGKKAHPVYQAWTSAKGRCFNPRHAKYHLYGARGITMCDEWREDFTAFLAAMGERPDGTSLDRIDNDGNYEPGNCRWATASEQQRNRRRFAKKSSTTDD